MSETAHNAPSVPRLHFGRRKTKNLKAGRKQAFEEGAKDYALPAWNTPQDLAEAVKDINELEIGFGYGEHLIHRAESYPDKRFLGIEVFADGIGTCVRDLQSAGIANVMLYAEDVADLIEALPENHFERIHILFPDPWPKRRNWKRRLVNKETLPKFARLLKQDGTLIIATDIPSYATWTLMALNQTPELTWQPASHKDWTDEPKDWTKTRYHQKAIREGRAAVFLEFKKG